MASLQSDAQHQQPQHGGDGASKPALRYVDCFGYTGAAIAPVLAALSSVTALTIRSCNFDLSSLLDLSAHKFSSPFASSAPSSRTDLRLPHLTQFERNIFFESRSVTDLVLFM